MCLASLPSKWTLLRWLRRSARRRRGLGASARRSSTVSNGPGGARVGGAAALQPQRRADGVPVSGPTGLPALRGLEAEFAGSRPQDDLDVQGAADKGGGDRADLRVREPSIRPRRLHRAGRTDGRCQYRAGAQANAEQGRKDNRAAAGAGRVVGSEGPAKGRAGALDQEAWQE